jgi:hypothetical protein
MIVWSILYKSVGWSILYDTAAAAAAADIPSRVLTTTRSGDITE